MTNTFHWAARFRPHHGLYRGVQLVDVAARDQSHVLAYARRCRGGLRRMQAASLVVAAELRLDGGRPVDDLDAELRLLAVAAAAAVATERARQEGESAA